MEFWEAKYQALAAGIGDDAAVARAEFMVRVALQLATRSGRPLNEVLNALLASARTLATPRIIEAPPVPRRPGDLSLGTMVAGLNLELTGREVLRRRGGE